VNIATVCDAAVVVATVAATVYVELQQICILKVQVNRAFKCSFCSKLYTIEATADDADIHSVLPPVKSCNHYLRPNGHIYALSRCDSEMHKKSPVPLCLFKYM